MTTTQTEVIKPRRWRWPTLLVLLAVWASITGLHLFLYRAIRDAILDEVRHHAMGVAIAAAAGINPGFLDLVHGPEDMGRPEFSVIQAKLDEISAINPDVRYTYTMRRSTEPGAGEGDYLYIVDQSAVDWNGNGIIDASEESELPGTPYDASDLPEMMRAWHEPAADHEITPDPPYGDLLSGYAPVRNAEGQTVAIVGVDIMADTIRDKVRAVSSGLAVGWVGLMALTALIYSLHLRERAAMDRIAALNVALEERNALLQAANEQIVAHYKQVEEEIRLAQTVQLGMLPQRFPRQDRIVFQKCYLTCTVLGGDLFDVFEVDENRIGLFMADVSGHGVSAALISGLVKSAVSTAREMSRDASATKRVDMAAPSTVMAVLNEILVNAIPDEDFITMIYAVIDLETNHILAASGGHPWPIRRSGARVEWLGAEGETGPALSFFADAEFPTVQVRLYSGDVLLFFTDGLTEAMNADGEEFGEARVLDVVRRVAYASADEVVEAIRQAVDEHRGESEVSDDFTLLAAEIRARTEDEVRTEDEAVQR